MTVNNISNTNRMLNISADVQAQNTSKLSSGFKVNRNTDDAASLTIKTKNADVINENRAAVMSNVSDIDKADALVEQAKKNILAQPDQAVLAQANQGANGVISLVQ